MPLAHTQLGALGRLSLLSVVTINYVSHGFCCYDVIAVSILILNPPNINGGKAGCYGTIRDDASSSNFRLTCDDRGGSRSACHGDNVVGITPDCCDTSDVRLLIFTQGDS